LLEYGVHNAYLISKSSSIYSEHGELVGAGL
jgi:hypothetical protein